MKKIVILFSLLVLCLNVQASENYYFKNIDDLKFLCYSEDNCFNATPEKIKIKNKDLVSFGSTYYYDIASYKYNKESDTYSVDIILDRDPGSTGGEASPYDNGKIGYLIFNIKYSPSKKIFKPTYKGFVTVLSTAEYNSRGEIEYLYDTFLNIYYDNDQKYISNITQEFEYFKLVSENIHDINSDSSYAAEIKILLKNL